MYKVITILVVVYAKVSRTATLCKLQHDVAVQYCFDPRNYYGLRRCNIFEPEGVIVRPGCGTSWQYSNQTLSPRRCHNGKWEDIFTCTSEISRDCKLESHPSVKHNCVGPDDAPRICKSIEPEGTVVRPECNTPLYYTHDPLPLMTCINGEWDNIATCLLDTIECDLPDGRKGGCVAYYYCDTANNTIIQDDGVGVIDIGGVTSSPNDGNCEAYIDTCCDVIDTRALTDPRVPDKPLEKEKGCGWRNPDGVGFQIPDVEDNTKFGEFPWACAVLTFNLAVDEKLYENRQRHLYVGGGSLIHPSVVLTAANYLTNNKRFHVRAGEWDTDTIKEIYPYQDRDIASIVIHEDFNNDNLFYDVAILFLTEPMDLAPNVGVTCLPPPRERAPEGTRCFAIGWRKDKFGMKGRFQAVLKKVELPVMGHSMCQRRLEQTRLGEYFQLHSSFMCAGGEEGVDACRGEMGAPLACPIKNAKDRFMQSGIVTWGIGCAKTGVPGVYVDVANLRDWIDDKVAAKGYDPKVYTYTT